MKQIKLNYLLIALAFTAVLASCHKDKITPTPDTPTAQRAGLYVLNQGGITHNNSTLTYYDYTTKLLVPDQFSVGNGGAILGDTSVCTGSTITLTDAAPGGIWTSGSPSVATISGAGVVTGLSAGIANIAYTLSGVCGTASAFAISPAASPFGSCLTNSRNTLRRVDWANAASAKITCSDSIYPDL